MSDLDFDAKARRLTQQLRASAEQVPPRRRLANRDYRADHPAHHLVLEFVIAGVLAVAVVALVFALPRHVAQVPKSAGPTQPVVSPEATPSPTPVGGIRSTVTAAPPLALYFDTNFPDGSVALAARTYSGQDAGTLLIPPSDSGYDVAPDGSKVLDGQQIIAVSGTVLGDIAGSFPQLPVWADDSAHVCGITATVVPGGAQVVGTIIEFDVTGRGRVVTELGPIGVTGAAWQVLACSPGSDRVVVEQDSGSTTSVIVVQLSTGRLIASHSAGDSSSTSAVASHDGSIVAVNGPSGVTIRNSTSWAALASVVRWGSQVGYPVIGAAVDLSWDGSRVIIDGGGAGGGFHPEWMVNWATGRNIITNTGSRPPVTGIDDAIPLPTGSAFFLPPGDVGSDPGVAYLLDAKGELEKLPG